MNQTQVGKKGIGRWLLFLLLVLLLIISFYPILWMFLGSFKTNNEIYQNALAFPTGFDFTVYRDAWIAANFSQALMNSLMITVISVVLIVLISSLAAFAFAVMDFKGKNALYLFILAGQIISAQIILIPLFSMFKSMQVLNTQWSAVIAYTAVGLSLIHICRTIWEPMLALSEKYLFPLEIAFQKHSLQLRLLHHVFGHNYFLLLIYSKRLWSTLECG